MPIIATGGAGTDMAAGLPSVDVVHWFLAVSPIVVLVTLVLKSRLSTSVNALLTVGLAVAVALVAFGAGPGVTGVAVGKGVWTGVWILYVIWPALLLFHLARRSGLDRLGAVLASILPTQTENVLIVAWVLPSFVQGVAGFGTPIAVAAPLLVSMGLTRVRAVALPLIGYHWSVTFGSMGSSFYIGALTGGVSGLELERYADDAAIVLGVNAVVSGVLVAAMLGGWKAVRESAPMIAIVGPTMALSLFAAVQVEPALGSLVAGAAGLVAVALFRAVRGAAPGPVDVEGHRLELARLSSDPGRVSLVDVVQPVPLGSAPVPVEETTSDSSSARSASVRPVVLLLPYIYLLIMVMAVFVPAGSRAWVKEHLAIGPGFGATETWFGLRNDAIATYNPIALVGHPGSFLLLAALLGYCTYRVAGVWPRASLGPTLRAWLRQASGSSLPVIGLATVATVMVDAGMVRMIAVGAAEATGTWFPVGSPLVGLVGSFTTGSTTSSNALFAALQHDIALLIDVHPSELLAAQTAGGNIGNSLAPVVLLIGASAVGARESVREIFRAVAGPAAVLVGVVVASILALIAASPPI